MNKIMTLAGKVICFKVFKVESRDLHEKFFLLLRTIIVDYRDVRNSRTSVVLYLHIKY